MYRLDKGRLEQGKPIRITWGILWGCLVFCAYSVYYMCNWKGVDGARFSNCVGREYSGMWIEVVAKVHYIIDCSFISFFVFRNDGGGIGEYL